MPTSRLNTVEKWLGSEKPQAMQISVMVIWLFSRYRQARSTFRFIKYFCGVFPVTALKQRMKRNLSIWAKRVTSSNEYG